MDPAALPAAVTVERPRNPEHGDYATNLALQVGQKVGANPRELAGWLATAGRRRRHRRRPRSPGPASSTCASSRGTGCVWWPNIVGGGARYGRPDLCSGATSTWSSSRQPDRPHPHRGTRWAAVGDALGRLLSTQSAEVVREYYFNDHGAQIDRFVNSLVAASQGEPAPEDGYAGAYIADIAAQVLAKAPTR